jgi:hypothetical protein
LNSLPVVGSGTVGLPPAPTVGKVRFTSNTCSVLKMFFHSPMISARRLPLIGMKREPQVDGWSYMIPVIARRTVCLSAKGVHATPTRGPELLVSLG